MTRLTKLRILLTLGAIIGIAPLTWSFLGASLLLAVALPKAPAFVIPVFLISVVGLWGCWKAYAAAMARDPVRLNRRVIIAVVQQAKRDSRYDASIFSTPGRAFHASKLLTSYPAQ